MKDAIVLTRLGNGIFCFHSFSKMPAMNLKIFLCLSLLSFSVCTFSQPELPADKKATKETVNLYRNLKKTMQKGIMFGHQDDYAYGVNWKYEPGRSDVKDVAGDYPAVIGFEIGRIELDWKNDIDGVSFDSTKRYIRQAYERGSVITISWHLNNPLNGKTAWDAEPGTVASILPGGEKNQLFNTWLDKVAVFMKSLKGENGEAIPVVFRPFHELNGSWFWWGKKHCTPDELKKYLPIHRKLFAKPERRSQPVVCLQYRPLCQCRRIYGTLSGR